MRIDAIKLTGLEGCRDLDLSFAPGFNVIVGGNGSGKTLCLWAIRAAFLGSVEPKAPSRGKVGVWVAKNGAQVGLERTLQNNAVVMTVTPQGGKPEVWYQGEGSGSAFEDAVDRCLGWGAVDAWLQFGVVPEGTLGEVSELMTALSGLEHGKWVLAELGEARANLLGDNNGHPGELEIINEELERKLASLADWEHKAQEIEALNRRLEQILQKQQEATHGADSREASYRNLVALQDLFAEREATRTKLAELQQQRDLVRDLVEAVDKAEKELEENYGDFLNAGTDLEDILQEWSEHTAKMHDIQRRMHVARQALAAAPKSSFGRLATMWGVSLGMLGVLAGLGAGAAQSSVGMGAGLALLGVLAAWAKDRNTAQVAGLRKQELFELEEENRAVEKALEETKSAMGKMGDMGHPMAIRRAVVQYWKAREDVERLRDRRNEHPPLIEAVNAYENKADALAAVESQIRQLKADSPYLADFEDRSRSLAGEIDMAKAQSDASSSRAERLAQERAQVVQQLERLSEQIPPLGRLERERKELARRKEETALEAESLSVCLEAWQEALDTYRRQAQEELATAVGGYFADFTDGRYSAVRRQGTGIEVQDRDGAWISVETLSDGTLEQLGMALRLAETAVRSSSLVLDNVFLRWDEERCDKARQALSQSASAGVQVLLFTHKVQTGSWGDHVVSLNEDVQEAA